MSDDGTSFAIDIPVTGGKDIDAAAASVDTLAVRLQNATKATVAAADGIKAAEASYKSSELAANKAVKALERIGLAADAQKGKLQAAMDAGDGKAVERATSKLKALSDRQTETAAKAKAAVTALEAEAAALDKVTKAEAAKKPKGSGDDEGINFEGLKRGLGRIGGPLAVVGEKVAEFKSGWDKVKSSVGEAGPIVAGSVAIAAVAAAVVALTVAVVASIVSLAAWAVQLADVNRTNELLAEGVVRSVKGGEALNAQINAATKRFPLARAEIAGMAANLAAAGFRGAALTDYLTRTAAITARLKFGPDFERQMLSLDEQSKVFHANLAQIFGGLKTDALMKALQLVGALLDEDTASGKAIKVVFESIFQPLVDGAAGAGVKVEAFFLNLEILALKALIAIKPYGSLFVAMGEGLLIVGAILAGTVVIALGLVVVSLAALGLFVKQTIDNFRDLWTAIVGWGTAVKNWFSSFSLADVGRSMVEGLVTGIASGGAAVVDAVTGAVGGAIDAAKKALGIASPSKVFAEIGIQTGAGMAEGVERSSGVVKSSLESMTSPDVAGASASAAATPAPASASAGKSISLTGPFYFYGVEGAEDAEARFGGLLTRVLEGDAAQLGGMVPA